MNLDNTYQEYLIGSFLGWNFTFWAYYFLSYLCKGVRVNVTLYLKFQISCDVEIHTRKTTCETMTLAKFIEWVT